MEFPLLDRYLLENIPAKAEVVETLLRERPGPPGAAPFYEGMRILGARTPELSLIALRLVLAGKKADDTGVKRLRDAISRVRQEPDRASALAAYKKEVS